MTRSKSRQMRKLAELTAKKTGGSAQPSSAPAVGPLADFELAPLTSLEPSRLRSPNGEEREIDALMLGLALMFNDLKDFLWFYTRLALLRHAPH
jgi:hypothetical protein